jgi:predicted TIM-barrel fold metal-dependent hydrolase
VSTTVTVREPVAQSRRYRLISGDSHVNEPPDLWTSRVPARFRDRAPHMQRFEQGDAWIIEGAADPINFGMNAIAGLPPEEVSAWKRFEDIRPGGYIGKERAKEMDRDGVDAEIIYPTPRLGHGVAATPEPAFHLALVEAYNDWLSEYCGDAPERFAGQMMIPNRGVDAAVAEIQRVAGRPGMYGALLSQWPNGSGQPTEEDDPVWQALVDLDWPLSVHVSLAQSMPVAHRSKLPGYSRFMASPPLIVEMIFSGMFDRFPTLPVVIAEVDCGWVPHFKEQVDGNYHRMSYHSDLGLPELPSFYIDRHIHYTYISDPFGLEVRHRIGVDKILWSSDFPHQAADWPFSWKTIAASTSGIPSAELDMILAGNACRLYGFGSER